MQLEAKFSALSAASYLGILLSLELFLASAEISNLRVPGYILLLCSLLGVASRRWDRHTIVSMLMFSLFFGAYLGSAAGRYPGLMKEPMPYFFSDLLGLMLKGSILVTIFMIAARTLWLVVVKLSQPIVTRL